MTVAGQAVDLEGIAMDWVSDNPAQLKPQANAVLQQLCRAIKPLEMNVQRQCHPLVLQHELDTLDHELTEQAKLDESTRALPHK